MTYTALSTPVYWPPQNDAGLTLTNRTIDASGEKVLAGMFRAPVTGTLDGFGIKLGTVTQAPANGLKFSFQDADTSAVPAVPDGTADQSNVVTAGITSGSWLDSGTLSRSVTKGDVVCSVVEFSSFLSGDNLQIQSGNGLDHSLAFPFGGLYTGSWAMFTGGCPMALRYSGGTYYHVQGLTSPWSSSFTATSAFGSGSTPDEYASKIVLPYSCKSPAFIIWADTDNALDVCLYDSGGSTVASKTMVPNLRSGASGIGMSDYWSSQATLAAGTYYLSIKPTSASTITARYLDVNSAGIMAACPGGVGGGILATRTDGGAWSETATRRLAVQLVITEIDFGSAGGGVIF